LTGRPVCGCHGLPMGWQKDQRCKAGGHWECREKRRIYNKRRHEQRVAWLREDRKKSPRQRFAKRRDHWKTQRAQALDKLAHLSEEMKALGTGTRPT